ncbi:MAG TPA: nucleotidyltransferase domain-containing protein [Candidatus Paceibacterota bacterium]
MERNEVKLVLLFGSAATGRQHPLSDTDIGVVFADSNRRLKEPVKVYGDLLEEMQKHFSGQIDLVYLEETPLSLQYRAVTDGRILYEARVGVMADYKEYVLKYYFDFQFIENIFHQAILAR